MRYWLIGLVALLAACSTTFQLRLGRTAHQPERLVDDRCGPYSPPLYEHPPLGVNIDDIPIDDPEAIALILATEVRELRNYIGRQDQRNAQALAEYRAKCRVSGKDP